MLMQGRTEVSSAVGLAVPDFVYTWLCAATPVLDAVLARHPDCCCDWAVVNKAAPAVVCLVCCLLVTELPKSRFTRCRFARDGSMRLFTLVNVGRETSHICCYEAGPPGQPWQLLQSVGAAWHLGASPCCLLTPPDLMLR